MAKEKDIQQRANDHYAARFDEDLQTLIKIVDMDYEPAEDADDELSYDEALERLQEMPLCFERLITDHRAEETTWEILLGTGGPADRVLVVTDERDMIRSATYQFQDWFEPWTDAENQDAELVQRFAEIVGYYEVA